MPLLRKSCQSASLLSLFLLVLPVLAHTVEVSGDVAATFHIEPNHNPKAGKPTLAWFALTRKGGEVIPLPQCNCQLAVFKVPYAKNAAPLIKPALRPINTEAYRGIPGAEITFPQAGQYQLRLSGTPKSRGNFQPFTFTYTVLVSGG